MNLVCVKLISLSFITSTPNDFFRFLRYNKNKKHNILVWISSGGIGTFGRYDDTFPGLEFFDIPWWYYQEYHQEVFDQSSVCTTVLTVTWPCTYFIFFRFIGVPILRKQTTTRLLDRVFSEKNREISHTSYFQSTPRIFRWRTWTSLRKNSEESEQFWRVWLWGRWCVSSCLLWIDEAKAKDVDDIPRKS
jgi:hypothetical protein